MVALHPNVLWAQTKDKLFLTVDIQVGRRDEGGARDGAGGGRSLPPKSDAVATLDPGGGRRAARAARARRGARRPPAPPRRLRRPSADAAAA
jgi:hypothetical protein